MKAHYKIRIGRIVFEVEGETQKSLFKAIAELADVFEREDCCGLCSSAAIRPRVRTVENNDFYEFVCEACGARIDLGQHKLGKTLFLKRRDESGAVLDNRGWYQYTPEQR